MDKETIIKGCENWVNNHKGENFLLTYSSVVELLDVLKEQEAKTQGADSGMCEICSFYERAMSVEPVLDEQTGRIWLCGKCGTYVGFEDNDPNDPNEFDKYCRECGRPVLWGSR